MLASALLVPTTALAVMQQVVQCLPNGWLSISIPREQASSSTCYEIMQDISRALTGDEGNTARGILISLPAGDCLSRGSEISELVRIAGSEFGPALRRHQLQMHSAVAGELALLSQKMPVISLADGMLTGTGSSLFMASSHRVATQSTIFAVPDVAYGLSPGGGALHFLTGVAVPQSLGLVCLLSGARLTGRQLLHPDRTELASCLCPCSDRLRRLRDRLLKQTPDDALAVLQQEAARADGAGDLCSDLEASRQILEAVERVVAATEPLRSNAAERIDAIQAGLASEASAASANGDAALWLAAQANALAHGCPAAQVVAYAAAMRQQRLDHRHTHAHRMQSALGMELAANSILACRGDFVEGASCAFGLRRGETPEWELGSREHAAADPLVVRLVACVLASSPLELDDPWLRRPASQTRCK